MDTSAFNLFEFSTHDGGSDVAIQGMESYQNDHKAVTKDGIAMKLIPANISECSLVVAKLGNRDVCSNSKTVEFIAGKLGISGDVKTIMESAKKKTNCGTEKCVVTKVVSDPRAMNVFKIEGPRDNKLLNNINIDKTLLQWGTAWPDFAPYNFNMLDYYDHSLRGGYRVDEPDTLASKHMDDNYEAGYRTMACVINSDTYDGPGKHWMALFVDMRGCKPNSTVKATIEFFNSSGNSPVPSWSNWMSKTQTQLAGIGIPSEIIPVANRKQQKSRSECGVYSLYYIWARLNKVPWDYFRKYPVPDQLMFEFRQHLFDGAGPTIGTTFSWEEYIKQVHVLWE
jgi:hypothetical protein